MKFLDFFAGIGGFRTGLEKAGHECLGFCEIDKYARQSYKAMHNTEGETEWHDITAVSDNDFRLFRGRVDIIAGGFPCQAFSVAGKRAGFNDTRGTLFFEIARAAKEIEPSYLFLENVKGLFSHDSGNTFRIILQTLDELGYIVEWGLFNSKYWGVPQNRERVFILATKKEVFKKPALFDLVKQQTTVTTRLRDILETNVDEKYYLSEEKTKKLVEQLGERFEAKENIAIQKTHGATTTVKDGLTGTLQAARLDKVPMTVEMTIDHPKVKFDLNHYGNDQMNRVYDVDGQAPTIIAVSGGGREAKIAEPQLNMIGHIEASGNDICKRVYSADGISPTVPTGTSGNTTPKIVEPQVRSIGNTNPSGRGMNDHVFDIDAGLAPTLTTNKGEGAKIFEEVRPVLTPDRPEKRQNGRRFKEDDEESFTLTAQDRHGVAIGTPPKYRIRKLTPLECFRLQGFTDEQFRKAEAVNSNSQLYKQAGNSVTVNVIQAIAKQIGGTHT